MAVTSLPEKRTPMHTASVRVLERCADSVSVRTLPEKIGSYEVVDRIAVGGMAEVFKVKKTGEHGFEKQFALKKILPHLAADRASVEMFLDEARVTASLEHPHIIQAFELGNDADSLYFAMEYVDGIDVLELLQDCARAQIRLPATLAALIARDVLDALDYAHEARDAAGRSLAIVHRDVSPSNVLLSWKGHVKLTDFGVALAARRRHQTAQHTLRGKYGYMSPEQVSGGHVDGRSDLFSVGVLLAEMVMARRLFVGPTDLDILLAVRDVKLDRLDSHASEFPIELLGIVLRALQSAPRDRWQTAGEMRDAIDAWLAKCDRVVSAGALELAAFVQKVTSAPTAVIDRTRTTGSMPFVRQVNPVIPPSASVTIRPAKGTPAPSKLPGVAPIAQADGTEEIELSDADALEILDEGDDVFDAVTADGLDVAKLAKQGSKTPRPSLARPISPSMLVTPRPVPLPSPRRPAREAIQPIVKLSDVRPTAEMEPSGARFASVGCASSSLQMRAFVAASVAPLPGPVTAPMQAESQTGSMAIDTADILLDDDFGDDGVEAASFDDRPTEQDLFSKFDFALDDAKPDVVDVIESGERIAVAKPAPVVVPVRKKESTGVVVTVPRRKKQHTMETAIASLVEESQILELPPSRAAKGTGRFETPVPADVDLLADPAALPRRARRDAVMPAFDGKLVDNAMLAVERSTAPMAVATPKQRRPSTGIPVLEQLPLPPRRPSTGNPAYEARPARRASTSISSVEKLGKLSRLNSVGRTGAFANYSDSMDAIEDQLAADLEPADVQAKPRATRQTRPPRVTGGHAALVPTPAMAGGTSLVDRDHDRFGLVERLAGLRAQMWTPLGILAMLTVLMVAVFLLAMYGVI